MMTHADESPEAIPAPRWTVALTCACALLPLLAIPAVYVLAAAAGHVPWCLPFAHGCTSISRAAREGLANPLFRLTMLPWAGLLAVLWWCCAVWLRTLVTHRAVLPALLGFGWGGAVCLALYAWHVGGDSDMAMWMRRYGGVVFFAFTAFAQMVLTAALAGRRWVPRGPWGVMLLLCLGMLVLGIGSIPLQHFVANRYVLVSAIEWNYALMMIGGFAALAALWARLPPRSAPAAPAGPARG